MLTRLRFENFKSWPSADIKCGKITGIFGTNSSGKTSLLQFLLLMKQTKDATDRATALELNADLVQLGTFTDVIYRHDEEKRLDWTMEFALPKPLVLNAASGSGTVEVARGDSLEIGAQVSGGPKAAPQTRRLSYTLGEANFSLKQKNGPNSQFEIEVTGASNGFEFKRNQGRAWQLPNPSRSYAFPDQARTYYQNSAFLSDLEKSYETVLDRIYYLGPLREFPKRDYLWARSKPTDVGKQGERWIDAILAATESDICMNLVHKGRKKPFQEIVAHWLKQLDLIDSFEVREIGKNSNRYQAWVRAKKFAPEVLLTDVGFGVSQVLPVITLLQYVPEGSTVLLEQPEIHLHPLAQAALADVLIQAATHRGVQIILESHSEHLLLRLQRRVAEGGEMGISANDVKLYFCDAQRGESKLTELDLNLFGTITNWPSKFMGDAFGEAAKAELARIKRMMATQPA